MAPPDLQHELETILKRIRQDRFGGREAPFVDLRKGAGLQPNGSVSGAFDVSIRRRDGEVVVLYTQSLDGISDARSLRDAFADALSTVLAGHNDWPR